MDYSQIVKETGIPYAQVYALLKNFRMKGEDFAKLQAPPKSQKKYEEVKNWLLSSQGRAALRSLTLAQQVATLDSKFGYKI